jgi:Mannose-6-phosphate isomerase
MTTQPSLVRSGAVDPLHVLGTEVRFLCEAESTRGVWSLMQVTLPLGAGPPPHVHDWDEGYFVIGGTVDFEVDERRFTAAAGDFVYTPAGVAHGFRGASRTPAAMLVFDAPAHAGTFFKRVDREAHSLTGDLPKVLEIGAETGIRFLQAA